MARERDCKEGLPYFSGTDDGPKRIQKAEPVTTGSMQIAALSGSSSLVSRAALAALKPEPKLSKKEQKALNAGPPAWHYQEEDFMKSKWNSQTWTYNDVVWT